MRVYLVFGKIWNLLWLILYVIEQIFMDVDGKILKNNLEIWLHWWWSNVDDSYVEYILGILIDWHAARLFGHPSIKV